MRIGTLLFVLLLIVMLTTGATAQDNYEILRGVVYATVDDVPLTVDIYRPRPVTVRPVVLVVHGGSWVSGDRGGMRVVGQFLAANGYDALVMDYRLAPRYTYPAQLQDLRGLVAWMQAHATDYGFDTARVATYGFSAGGQLAALLALEPEAARQRFRGVIACAGPMDFTVTPPSVDAQRAVETYLGTTRAKTPGRYVEASPISHVRATSPPFFLVHGDGDTIVPPDQSRRMARALRAMKVPVSLHLLPGMEHRLPTGASAAERAVRDGMLTFLARCMAPPR